MDVLLLIAIVLGVFAVVSLVTGATTLAVILGAGAVAVAVASTRRKV